MINADTGETWRKKATVGSPSRSPGDRVGNAGERFPAAVTGFVALLESGGSPGRRPQPRVAADDFNGSTMGITGAGRARFDEAVSHADTGAVEVSQVCHHEGNVVSVRGGDQQGGGDDSMGHGGLQHGMAAKDVLFMFLSSIGSLVAVALAAER